MAKINFNFENPYEFATSHYWVNLRSDCPFHGGESAEIVGVRTVKNIICYTIRFSNGYTTEIPAEPQLMKQYTKGNAYQKKQSTWRNKNRSK